MCQQYKSFENTVGKGEIATMFSTLSFSLNSKLLSAKSSLKSKFSCLRKGQGLYLCNEKLSHKCAITLVVEMIQNYLLKLQGFTQDSQTLLTTSTVRLGWSL